MTVTASETFEREFLPMRGKLLEIAAALDRVARAEGSVSADPRMRQFLEALALLAKPGERCDRAEQVQLLFSLPYDPDWRR